MSWRCSSLLGDLVWEKRRLALAGEHRRGCIGKLCQAAGLVKVAPIDRRLRRADSVAWSHTRDAKRATRVTGGCAYDYGNGLKCHIDGTFVLLVSYTECFTEGG